MSKTSRFLVTASAALALLAISPAMVSAASISWQSSVQMYPGSTSQSFVSTTGDTVLAMNATPTVGGPHPLNGVSFTNVNAATFAAGYTDGGVTVSSTGTLPEHPTAFGDGSFSSDGDIFELLRSGFWESTEVNFSGLTDGAVYQIQIFTNDARNGRHSNFQLGLGDGTQGVEDSNTAGTAGFASLSNRDPNTGDGEPSGDYIIGTFNARGTTQSFATEGSTDGFAGFPGNSAGRSQINGLQLRLLAVPEPATFALFGIGCLAMIGSRRRA